MQAIQVRTVPLSSSLEHGAATLGKHGWVGLFIEAVVHMHEVWSPPADSKPAEHAVQVLATGFQTKFTKQPVQAVPVQTPLESQAVQEVEVPAVAHVPTAFLETFPLINKRYSRE